MERSGRFCASASLCCCVPTPRQVLPPQQSVGGAAHHEVVLDWNVQELPGLDQLLGDGAVVR